MSVTDQYPDFTGLTFEKVWAVVMKTSQAVDQLEKSVHETSLRMQQSQENLNKQLAKTDERFAKTDVQFAKTDAQLAKTDAQLAKTDAQLAKTDRQLARTDKQLGNLGNRLGEVIEQLITAGAIPRFNAMGYHFTKASTRVKIIDPKTDRTRAEADVVLENGEALIIVEVKTEPSLSNIQQHIRRLQIFREDRDKSSPNDGKKIFGAIAAAVFPDEVQEAALSAGFYVIVQSGDTVNIAVPEGFVPTAF